MRAMLLQQLNSPLQEIDYPLPSLRPHQLLLKVLACGVCRTDLHLVEGELPSPHLPVIPGHEIVGAVAGIGNKVERFKVGDRVGVPWLGSTCGKCRFCQRGEENLCDQALFTGYQLHGGYAEYTVADERFCFSIPPRYSDLEAAPLLCAGLIGYRSYVKAQEAESLGIYGFGAAAHLMIQVARFQGKKVHAFTRPQDFAAQQFALSLGAIWAGSSDALPPEKLDAAILYAPVGSLIPKALRAVRKGGIVVCAGIHMSEIPSFPYALLWGERTLCSVANLTRKDGEDFLKLAPQIPIRTHVEPFPLKEANRVLQQLREGKVQGAAVLVP